MEYKEQKELRSMLGELHNLFGFRLSFYDTKFREIESYPEKISPYCRLIQSTEAGRCRCIENDLKAFEHVRKQQEVYLYKCCFGLYEAVAPLYVLGNLVGYLMMGQSIDSSPGSREAIIRNASPYVSDRDSLCRAADAVCLFEKDKILSCMKILDICAQYISFSNRFILGRTDVSDKIKQYIDDNYASNITIEGICLKFFCSRTTIMKTFKSKYGVSIIEYLTRVRIQAAKRLISNTAKSIREVAESCGYSDQNYFNKVFSRRCGMTPSAYRKNKTA